VDEPPPDFTLEELADDAGVDPEDVREWLRREIERRRNVSEPGDKRRCQPSSRSGSVLAHE
jgi:hypothetical protein